MEATICTSTPDVPAPVERQAAKLPDAGAPKGASDKRNRRAMYAGLIAPASGLGNPMVAKPTLGA